MNITFDKNVVNTLSQTSGRRARRCSLNFPPLLPHPSLRWRFLLGHHDGLLGERRGDLQKSGREQPRAAHREVRLQVAARWVGVALGNSRVVKETTPSVFNRDSKICKKHQNSPSSEEAEFSLYILYPSSPPFCRPASRKLLVSSVINVVGNWARGSCLVVKSLRKVSSYDFSKP